MIICSNRYCTGDESTAAGSKIIPPEVRERLDRQEPGDWVFLTEKGALGVCSSHQAQPHGALLCAY